MAALAKNVKKLLNVYDQIKREGGVSEETFQSHLAELKKIKKEIIEILMWAPGSLIHLDDPIDLGEAEKVVNRAWEEIDIEEHYDKVMGAGYSGLMVNTMGNYADRAKKIKPSFISTEISKEFKVYYEQAMKSWCFGLDQAALILCCSIIETSLKKRLEDFLQHVPSSLGKTITKAAKFDIIDENQKNELFKIQNLRNNAVHELQNIDTDEAYDAIKNTKNIIEDSYQL